MHPYHFTANPTQSDTADNLFKAGLHAANSIFINIETLTPNQTQKSQIRMIHKVSGIRCSLHFNSEGLRESAEMILQVINFNPMGKSIILLIFFNEQLYNFFDLFLFQLSQ